MLISEELKRKYTINIGIECHVQLKTKTKLFSSVGNDARIAKPNTLINHVDIGMPGSLPVLNKQAVNLAIKAGLALEAKLQKFSKFDRKHYFYPDLPKGYQITQYDQPIIIGGYVDIQTHGKVKRIGITRAHLEEDAGKNTHPSGTDYSLVDLNRAGTPLLEIVSEPQISSAEEAKAYARELYLLMRYADVSEADMFHGNMRFDVNISVTKDSAKMGTRAEVKNLNSFRSVAAAAEYEIHRQIELIESGKKVLQETRGWDEAKQKTVSQRGKEEAHDYRYMPEPDIPPLELTDGDINAVAKQMPMLPNQLRSKLAHLKLDESAVETLVEHIEAGRFMLNVLNEANNDQSKHIANLLVGEVQSMVVSGKLIWPKAMLEVGSFIKLSKMLIDNKLSATNAKKIVRQLVLEGGDPQAIAKKSNLLQVSDEGQILKIVEKVINNHPQAAKDVKQGESKAIGFLIGQVMRESKGQANPVLAEKLIKQALLK